MQGIQGFIFQTNALREVVGASALVEEICTECFDEFAVGQQVIVRAAGNIKCIFNDEEACRRTVREFPKKVLTEAPGITISQAVVPMGDDTAFADAVNLLEEKLRAQRNKPMPSITLGLMGIERSRRTGLPAVSQGNDGEPIDRGTKQKLEYAKSADLIDKLYYKFFGAKVATRVIAHDVSDMTVDNSWLAVIHADGNGLGQVVSAIGSDKERLKKFSEGLDRATTAAAQKAYKALVKSDGYDPVTDVIPFRPVVLGGDDLTLICRADLALEFTRQYIDYFEKETGVLLGLLRAETDDVKMKCLTACAGIAFIKESYPFYYGYNLAEALCERAKRDAKSKGEVPAPSCLMFHKVQSSFVEDYDEMMAKELTPCEGHSFCYGPYYIHERDDRWTVEKLLQEVAKLKGKEGNAAKSDIRQWMTWLGEDPAKAEQKSKRVYDVSSAASKKIYQTATTPRSSEKDAIQKPACFYPAYDMLALHSILTQVTKNR